MSESIHVSYSSDRSYSSSYSSYSGESFWDRMSSRSSYSADYYQPRTISREEAARIARERDKAIGDTAKLILNGIVGTVKLIHRSGIPQAAFNTIQSTVASAVHQIRETANTDARQAQQMAHELQQQVRQQQAQALQQQQEELIRQQQERRLREIQAQLAQGLQQLQSQFVQSMTQQITRTISDPIALDSVLDEVQAIQSQYARRAASCNTAALEALIVEFQTVLRDLKLVGESRAAKKRLEIQRNAQVKAAQDALALQRQMIQSMESEATKIEFQPVIKQVEQAEQMLQDGNLSDEAVTQVMEETIQKAEKIVEDETLRRETLKAIVESLQLVGFVVESPVLVDGVVELAARRPSGEECVFYVDLKGGMEYHFDHYDGSACKKDIDQILPRLQDVYGIKLSNERVIWSNPDRISREARQQERPESRSDSF